MKQDFITLKKFKIGITMFIGIVIFIALMFIVGSETNMFTSTYTLRLFLTDINGLANGSMVSLGGMKIGTVSALEFGEQQGRSGVIVTAKLRTLYRPQITTASIASVKTIGMLGDKYVDITIGAPVGKPLPDGSFIAVRQTLELSDVMEQFTGVISDVSASAANVRAISDSVRRGRGSVGRLLLDDTFADEISTITIKLRVAASSLTDRRSTFGRLLQDDDLYVKLDHAAANLASVTDSLRTGKGTAGQLLMNDSLYRTLSSISHRMDALLTNLGSDSSSVGPLLNSALSYHQLTELVANMNALVADIRENPKKYVRFTLF